MRLIINSHRAFAAARFVYFHDIAGVSCCRSSESEIAATSRGFDPDPHINIIYLCADDRSGRAGRATLRAGEASG